MNARQAAMALALAAGLVTGASADDGSGCYPKDGCYPPDHPVWVEAQKVQDASEAAWKRSPAAKSCRYLRTECHYDPGTKLGQCRIVAQCKSSPTGGSVEASFNGGYGRSPEQIGRLRNCNGQLTLDGCPPSPAPDTSGKGSLPPDILDRINNAGADSDDMERRCRDAFAKSRARTSCTLTSVSADGLGLLGPTGSCWINAKCKTRTAGWIRSGDTGDRPTTCGACRTVAAGSSSGRAEAQAAVVFAGLRAGATAASRRRPRAAEH